MEFGESWMAQETNVLAARSHSNIAWQPDRDEAACDQVPNLRATKRISRKRVVVACRHRAVARTYRIEKPQQCKSPTMLGFLEAGVIVRTPGNGGGRRERNGFFTDGQRSRDRH